jgi:hypothetical protein
VSLLVWMNILGAGLLSLTCFALLAQLIHRQDSPHYQAFLLFFGLFVLVASLISFQLIGLKIKLAQPWEAALDGITLPLIGLAAYSLNRGKNFSWSDKFLPVAGAAFLAYEIFIIVAGYKIDEAPRLWRVIYVTPSALASAAGFVAVGVGVLRDEAVGFLRVPLFIVFGVYAILQPVYYYFEFLFTEAPDAPDAPERGVLRLFVGLGKFILLLALAVIAISRNDPERSEATMKTVRVGVALLGVAFGIFLFVYRFLGFVHASLPAVR